MDKPVEASAPCRVDAGGTWDIKAMALTMEREAPVTFNAALDLRTKVRLLPYEEGRVRVVSEGFQPEGEAGETGALPLVPPFGLFFAAVERFGFHGVEVRIASESPPRSALGGSSTALTALLRALSTLGARLGEDPLPPKDLLLLGYHLEDGISGGFCGMQDQAAAVYGGVNLWRWQYASPGTPVLREALLDARGGRELTRRILVAHSGRDHDSGSVNRGWVEGFLSGRTRKGWVEANRSVHRLCRSLRAQDWTGAAKCLREEMAVRREITPDALIPETRTLIDAAEAAGCGARFAGAGAGGAVWAIGSLDRIRNLRPQWEALLGPMDGGRLLDCAVDPKGVR
jgi:D-glycero-alpha-D-manno-heptose-7-phosphate kinase